MSLSYSWIHEQPQKGTSWIGNSSKTLPEMSPNTELVLVRIFLYSDWIRRFSKSPYSIGIRENTDQKELRTWTLFTQWNVNFVNTCKALLKNKNKNENKNFSRSALVHMKYKVCLKYFVHDCLWKYLFASNLSQVSLKLNLLTYSEHSKAFNTIERQNYSNWDANKC